MQIQIRPDIHLGPLQWSDMENIVRHANHPSTAKNTTSVPHPYTHDNAAFFLKMWADKAEIDPKNTALALRKEGHGLIGAMGVHFVSEAQRHCREFGYWTGFEFRNQGITTDAARVFSDWLLAYTDIERLQAHVFSYNLASMRVLEKAGFQQEGYIRKYFRKDGELVDAYLYSKIKNT